MEIKSVDKTNVKKNFTDHIRDTIFRLGGIFEVVVIIFFWWVVFENITGVDGFTREEMISYILIGGIIGVLGGSMLNKIIVQGISYEKIDLLIRHPLEYFLKVFRKIFSKSFIPFLFAVCLQVLLLYFLVGNIFINVNILYWLVILPMVFLSLIFEFLMFYLLRLLLMKDIESKKLYNMVVRLKNILSGKYFPLSIPGILFLNISLSFPFAYSFFVPTQLYLKEIELGMGARGLLVQLVWIIIFYLAIKYFWYNKNKKQEKKEWKPEFREFKNK